MIYNESRFFSCFLDKLVHKCNNLLFYVYYPVERVFESVHSVYRQNNDTYLYLKCTHWQLFDHREVIVSISNEANHEAALEIMLKKVPNY